MSIQEKKTKLIQSILMIDDEELLERINLLIGEPEDWALNLSQVQRDGILAARKSIDDGKGLSDEDVWAEFDRHFADQA
jgi:hypothetical protein